MWKYNDMNNSSIPIFDLKFEDISEEISRLASELHHRRNDCLVIEVVNSDSLSMQLIEELYYIEGSELKFFSIAARNHCTAVHSFRKFEVLNAQKIFDEAHQLEIDEIGHIDFASGRFLGLFLRKLMF